MKTTIYHNSRCSKSRETFALLEGYDDDLEIIEYVKNPPGKDTLQELVQMLGIHPCALVRTKEAVYKEKYADKALSDDECLDAMVEDPILIERPIVVRGDKAVLGRPPENVHTLYT